MSKMVEHGTDAGYQHHTRYGTPSCEECRAAHAEYQRQLRSDAPRRRLERARNNARTRALWELARKYPDDFVALVSSKERELGI